VPVALRLMHTMQTPEVMRAWESITARNGFGPGWFRQNVSEYSASHPVEALAETFALLTRADYVRGTLPKAIEDYVFRDLLGEH